MSAYMMSIEEFCETHRISRSMFYLLRAKGRAPRLARVGKRSLISVEAAAEWRRSMEQPCEQGDGGDPGLAA